MLTKFVALLLSMTVLAVVWMNLSTGTYPKIPNELTFQRIDGQQHTFKDILGKPLLVTFWSPSCAICMHEVDALNRLYSDQQGGSRFELLGLSMYHDRPDSVLESSQRAGMIYPVYLDLDKQLSLAFGNVMTTPTTFLINAEGNIVFRHSGKLDISKITQKINALAG